MDKVLELEPSNRVAAERKKKLEVLLLPVRAGCSSFVGGQVLEAERMEKLKAETMDKLKVDCDTLSLESWSHILIPRLRVGLRELHLGKLWSWTR